MHVQFVDNIRCLACTCRTAYQEVNLILDAKVKQVVVPNGIGSRNEQLVEFKFLVDDKWRLGLSPADKRALLVIINHIEQVRFLLQFSVYGNRLKLVGQVQVELIGDVRCSAD